MVERSAGSLLAACWQPMRIIIQPWYVVGTRWLAVYLDLLQLTTAFGSEYCFRIAIDKDWKRDEKTCWKKVSRFKVAS